MVPCEKAPSQHIKNKSLQVSPPSHAPIAWLSKFFSFTLVGARRLASLADYLFRSRLEPIRKLSSRKLKNVHFTATHSCFQKAAISLKVNWS